MATEVLISMFLKVQVAVSCAILLTVALRLPVRRLFGAEIGYSLWLLAPIAGMAALFPSIAEFINRLQESPTSLARILIDLRAPILEHARLALLIWAAGAILLAGLFALGQWRFERSARSGEAGPAATGFWPTMVVPSDYAARYTPEERRLIRAHERAHMDRRDPTSNLTVALFQVIGWFNPLVHLAASLARMDQELSIDAKVMALYPKGRRRYAETLLKAHTRGFNSPLACALALGARHPLEVRLAMLGMRRISVKRDTVGYMLIGGLGMAIFIVMLLGPTLVLSPL